MLAQKPLTDNDYKRIVKEVPKETPKKEAPKGDK